jgi:ABC-type multidrug transport system fused ATPase/permease subunit
LLLGAQLVLLAVPYVAGRAINVFQQQGFAGMREAAMWLFAILGIHLVSWIMHGPGRFFERHVSLTLRQRMSEELIERLMQLPLFWHESQHSGAVSHRVQQTVNSMAGFAENQFVYLNALVRLFGPIIMLWLIQPWLGITAIIGFFVIHFSMKAFDRKMIVLAVEENDAERRYASTIMDALGNATTLFALRQTRAVIRLLQHRLQDIFKPVKRSIAINEFKWFTVEMCSRTLACLLVVEFAWLASTKQQGSAVNQALLLGNIYMVWEYAQQAGGVVTAVAAHFQAFARLQADYASADIIRDAPVASYLQTDSSIQNVWSNLDITHVSYRHPASRTSKHTLNEVAVSLQRGRRYALIGASGSGKSTLLRLLAGLYPADSIACELDGKKIDDPIVAAKTLRSSVTLIPQDAEVYEGTIAENLALCEAVSGEPHANEFLQALQVAKVDDFIELSSSGLNQKIAERGANWSGGQRARLALARGILAARDSQLILLDEPTASLDVRTEAAVHESMFRLFAQSCVVSSVHRMNLLPQFDEIIMLQDGRLVAQGTLAELQSQCMEFQALMTAYQKTLGSATDQNA